MRRILIVLALLVAGLVAFDYLAPHTAARTAAQIERWRADLRENRATVSGFDIAYLDGGAGEPLLLVHGFGADKDNFTRVAGRLTPHYRVIIPDLPGFGESSKPDTVSYSIAEQVERVRAFAQHLGLQRFHLGGSSMGGAIATAYAAKYPAEVASLWLLAPAGTAAAFDSELRQHYQKTGENLLVARTPEDHARVRAFVMSKPPFLPYSIRRVLGERAAANYPLHSKIFAELNAAAPIESYVTRIDAPALIVWGTQDRALNPKGAAALKALMPNAQVILMEGIGHLPMIEAAGPSARDYLAFRQGLPAQ